jgi:hypothetical protein
MEKMNLKIKIIYIIMQHLLDNTSDTSNRMSYYSNSSNESNVVKKLVNKHEKLINNIEEKKNVTCEICKDHDNNSNYIILSCNHICHINCLVKSHYKDIYDYPIIDNEYFENRKCIICDEKLELEQIMYLHGTFISNTKTLINNHQNSIENLEGQLQQLKIELRTLYDYKHKLEKEREKSKQIISILNTIM